VKGRRKERALEKRLRREKRAMKLSTIVINDFVIQNLNPR
jgi:hypothetical protein